MVCKGTVENWTLLPQAPAQCGALLLLPSLLLVPGSQQCRPCTAPPPVVVLTACPSQLCCSIGARCQALHGAAHAAAPLRAALGLTSPRDLASWKNQRCIAGPPAAIRQPGGDGLPAWVGLYRAVWAAGRSILPGSGTELWPASQGPAPVCPAGALAVVWKMEAEARGGMKLERVDVYLWCSVFWR